MAVPMSRAGSQTSDARQIYGNLAYAEWQSSQVQSRCWLARLLFLSPFVIGRLDKTLALLFLCQFLMKPRPLPLHPQPPSAISPSPPPGRSPGWYEKSEGLQTGAECPDLLRRNEQKGEERKFEVEKGDNIKTDKNSQTASFVCKRPLYTNTTTLEKTSRTKSFSPDGHRQLLTAASTWHHTWQTPGKHLQLRYVGWTSLSEHKHGRCQGVYNPSPDDCRHGYHSVCSSFWS
ncbi:uncharacterized protein LOC112563114 isoform X2 [Pomacea canaliculata]|uniref:uncharacterized protein LOC112563114 isoform X2 n=1 Tax=Pomacea canaliculata TaxID=400727 RepID=UPI000D7263B9|nr:uncharacterized protein LOC112563114 isoform X2 [Pomacea canaliculata]